MIRMSSSNFPRLNKLADLFVTKIPYDPLFSCPLLIHSLSHAPPRAQSAAWLVAVMLVKSVQWRCVWKEEEEEEEEGGFFALPEGAKCRR